MQRMMASRLAQRSGSSFDRTVASSQHEGTERVEAPRKHLASNKLAGTICNTPSAAQENPNKSSYSRPMLQDRIDHLERENAELRQCCRNQAVNLREQELILHGQREAQMRQQLGEIDARTTATRTGAESARHARKRQGNVTQKRPKTMRRDGCLLHALYVVRVAPFKASSMKATLTEFEIFDDNLVLPTLYQS